MAVEILVVVVVFGIGWVAGAAAGVSWAVLKHQPAPVTPPEPDHSRCIDPQHHVSALRAAYQWGVEVNERLVLGAAPVSKPDSPNEPESPSNSGEHQRLPWEDWPLPTTFPDPTDDSVPDDDGSRVAVGPLPSSPWLETPDMTGELY